MWVPITTVEGIREVADMDWPQEMTIHLLPYLILFLYTLDMLHKNF